MIDLVSEISSIRNRVAALNALLMAYRRTGGGGGGAGKFTELTDTPSSYSGHAGKDIIINSGETGLEFINRIDTFAELLDSPGALSGHGGDFPRVNSIENALEYGLETAIDAGMLDGCNHTDIIKKPQVRRYRYICPHYFGVPGQFFCDPTYSSGGGSGRLFDSTVWYWHAAAATASQAAHLSMSDSNVCRQQNYLFKARIRPQNVNDCRIWIGLSNPYIRSAPNYQTDNPTASYTMFRYSITVGPNWYAVTRDGGIQTSVNTGVAAQVNSIYNMEIESNYGAGSVIFRLNGSTVATITTNLPGANTGMSPCAMIVTVSGGMGVQRLEYSYFGADFD